MEDQPSCSKTSVAAMESFSGNLQGTQSPANLPSASSSEAISTRIQCYLCSQVLENNEELLSHLVDFHAAYQYHCLECKFFTNSKDEFDQHLSLHQTKPFSCNKCPEKFPSEVLKEQHEQTVHSTDEHSAHNIHRYRFECKSCDKTFSFEGSLKKHEQSVHNKGITYTKSYQTKCYLCEDLTVFESNNFLMAHLVSAHGHINPMRCEQCNFIAAKLWTLNKHVSLHDASTRPYKCRFCSMRFRISALAKQHEKNVHRANLQTKPQIQESIKTEEVHIFSELPPDDFCSSDETRVQYTITTENGSSFHIEESLPQATSSSVDSFADVSKIVFRCYLCSTVTQHESQDSLDKHLSNVHPSQDTYSCSKCNDVFSDKLQFNEHLAQHDLRPHECTVCKMRFASRMYRKSHEAEVHNFYEEKQFPCPFCDALLDTKFKLKNHITKDHKDRRYHCAECGEWFSHNIPYEKHFITTKRKLDPKIHRTCYLCSPSVQLTNVRALEKHLSTHPSENIYVCKKCDLRTPRKEKFNKHLKLHDPNYVPFKCEGRRDK